jgi:hypothetical protein
MKNFDNPIEDGKIRLFLDDLRDPPEDGYFWWVVRSFDQFTWFIQEFGIPDVISFDHDLGMDSATGKDAANWLAEQDLDGTHKIPEGFQFFVHSANPCGAANIQGFLDRYLEFLGRK